MASIVPILQAPLGSVQDQLRRQLCVRHPYFALEQVVVVEPGVVACSVPVEQELGRELPPIRAGEAGRHLAILGSCALASLGERRGQHFYLAKAARIETCSLSSEPVTSLIGTARGHFVGKRSGLATADLATPEGVVTHVITVEYDVMPAATFYRLFAAQRTDLRLFPREPGVASPAFAHSGRNNPYREVSVFADERQEGPSMTASIPMITASLCNGHFAETPLLPVAVVMGSLMEVAGRLLVSLSGDPTTRYFLHAAEIAAHQFAQIGKPLFLSARHVGFNGSTHDFECMATTEDGLIGEMTLTLASL